MSMLTLVRHGQASFFSDNYDKLSELGEEQSRVLGAHWAERGDTFDLVYAGTLDRQQCTASCAGEKMLAAGRPWPETRTLEGLNEYGADGIMKIIGEELAVTDPEIKRLTEENDRAETEEERYRSFHRLLAELMTAWIEKRYESNGLETWAEFRDRVRGALETIVREAGSGTNVAVFTSGGPIGASVQAALQAPEVMAGELNWRVLNASLTCFAFSPGRFTLDAFNRVPHLSDPDLLTYR